MEYWLSFDAKKKLFTFGEALTEMLFSHIVKERRNLIVNIISKFSKAIIVLLRFLKFTQVLGTWIQLTINK